MTSFLDKRKQQLGISSIGQKLREGRIRSVANPDSYVKGPKYIDCLTNPWARGKMMGLIGPSGSGKTELVLDCFYHMLKNNPNPRSICVFVTLENTVDEVAERWIDKLGDNNELSDRLYVVSNYLEDGGSRTLNVFSIEAEVERIKSVLDADVVSVAIDHLHVIDRRESEDLNKVCHYIKNIAVKINTFLILLSQTQKVGNVGDIPLDQNASYGCSQFSWISDWVLTIHSPLKRVADQTNLNILAFQYAKIRSKHKDDPMKVGINHLLSYNMDTRMLKEPSEEEKIEFTHLYSMVLELREAEEKTKFAQYNLGKKRMITNEQKVFKNQ